MPKISGLVSPRPDIDVGEVLPEELSEPRPDIVGNPNSEPVDDRSPVISLVSGINDVNPDMGLASCCMAMEVNADEGSEEANGIDDSCVNEGMP